MISLNSRKTHQLPIKRVEYKLSVFLSYVVITKATQNKVNSEHYTSVIRMNGSVILRYKRSVHSNTAKIAARF